MATKKERERNEAITYLRENVKLVPGDTVYTTVRSVARSGMSRTMDVYVMRDNEPWRITYSVAKATGHQYDDRREALRIGGCGMDMGFALVYDLSYALWPDGFDCIDPMNEDRSYRTGCPSNDHSNHPRDTFTHHDSGGYALRHRWMG